MNSFSTQRLVAAALLIVAFTTGFTCSKNAPTAPPPATTAPTEPTTESLPTPIPSVPPADNAGQTH